MIFDMEEVKIKDISREDLYELLREHKKISVKYLSYYGVIKQLTKNDFPPNSSFSDGLDEKIWLFSNDPEMNGGWRPDRHFRHEAFESYAYAYRFYPGELEDMILFKTQTLYDLIIE